MRSVHLAVTYLLSSWKLWHQHTIILVYLFFILCIQKCDRVIFTNIPTLFSQSV